jgi:cytochrome c2
VILIAKQIHPLALAALGCALVLPGPGAAQQGVSVAQSAEAGARVFGAKGCAGCHAVDGVGGGVGPDLARVPEAPSLFGLTAAMWNHLPAMAARLRERDAPPPTLAPWEAGDLVAFLFAIRYYSPPGDRDLGAAVFTGKGCVRCHQVRGAGGVIGPALDDLAGRGPPIELAAALWNHAPGMEREMTGRGIRRPALTGADLGNLRAFLSDTGMLDVGQVHLLPGREDAGRRLFRAARCAVCHGAEGRGGPFGPDLSAVPRRDLTEFAAAMWNKAPGMTAAAERARVTLPRLAAGEMADLVAYLGTLQYLAGEGSAARGAAGLGSLGCRRCHSAGGPGRAPDLARARGTSTPGGVLAALWNHVALPDSVLRTRWDTLGAGDVADLTAYFTKRGNGL